MPVTLAFHSCLQIELGPICNSIAASLCFKSCEDHSLLKGQLLAGFPQCNDGKLEEAEEFK